MDKRGRSNPIHLPSSFSIFASLSVGKWACDVSAQPGEAQKRKRGKISPRRELFSVKQFSEYILSRGNVKLFFEVLSSYPDYSRAKSVLFISFFIPRFGIIRIFRVSKYSIFSVF